MDIINIISFTEKYLSDYAKEFLNTLAHPIERFQSTKTVSNSIQQQNTAINGNQSHSPLLFVLISIFIGSILNSLVPGKTYSVDIVSKIIAILFLWFFFAAYTHVLCRIFRGKAKFEQTLWVSLQVFAMLYIVISFVNLVGGVIVRHPEVSSFLISQGKLGDSIASNPFYIYFLVQFILFNFFLPLAIKIIYNFGWIRPVLVGIALSLFWVWFGIMFSSDIGIHYRKKSFLSEAPNNGIHWKTSSSVFNMNLVGYPSSLRRITFSGNPACFQ